MSRRTTKRMTLDKAIKASENPSVMNEERVAEVDAVIQKHSKKRGRVRESTTSEAGAEDEDGGSTRAEGDRRDAPSLLDTLKRMTRGSAHAASLSVPETESEVDVAGAASSLTTAPGGASASHVGRVIDRWTDASKRGNDQAQALFEKHNDLARMNARMNAVATQQDGMLVQLIIEKQREDTEFQKKMIEELKASFGGIAAGADLQRELALMKSKVEELGEHVESFKGQIMALRMKQEEHTKRLDDKRRLAAASPRSSSKRSNKARKTSGKKTRPPSMQTCLKCGGLHHTVFKGFCDLDRHRKGVAVEVECHAWIPHKKPQEFDKHTGHEHVNNDPRLPKLSWHPKCSVHEEWKKENMTDDEEVSGDENATDDDQCDN